MSRDRTERWLTDLRGTLETAAELVERGESAYRQDTALPLAFEALCTRVGELAKRISTADPSRRTEEVWNQAARTRDFMVHHYDRIDLDVLWTTVTVSLPRLRDHLEREQR